MICRRPVSIVGIPAASAELRIEAVKVTDAAPTAVTRARRRCQSDQSVKVPAEHRRESAVTAIIAVQPF